MNRYEWKARLFEPSTWSGLAVLTAVFGADVAPDTWANVATLVTTALAVFIPEKGASK